MSDVVYEQHYLDIADLVIDDLAEGRDGFAAIDLINIQRAVDGDEEVKVKLLNGYTITYTNESGETITTTIDPNTVLNSKTDKLILQAI